VSSGVAAAATRAAVTSAALVQDPERQQSRAPVEEESAVRSASREIADQAVATALRATAPDQAPALQASPPTKESLEQRYGRVATGGDGRMVIDLL
jgi:hypothetical protein